MNVEVKIDSSYNEPKIIIYAAQITDEINSIVKRLSEGAPQVIVGFCDDTLKILDQAEIVRIYTDAGKVYAETESGEYVLRLRIYEMEDRLDKGSFVRISNSEIVNLRKIKGFDLSFSGTICVSMTNGSVTYVSRRYVAKIKKVLGI